MQILFVLVEPAVPENIGASARALKTMGFDQLRLVNTEQHQHKQARILAHGSGEVLEKADCFDSLPEALADVDLSIATTAKPRHGWRDLLSPAEVRDVIANKTSEKEGDALSRVAIVFGCEESGLSNEQLEACDLLTGIPMAVAYPSLNLSQAVMLYAYELSRLNPILKPSGAVHVQAQDAQWLALKTKLEQLLPALTFEPDSALYRWATEKLGQLSTKDIGFLHSLCDKVSEKIK
ncbi:tRNA/rRNA methyltransferase [Pseudomaricurvus alkylphenolicus]|uniref:tRNA/rRNA methyltransferase n=1 Tax=Pseudomaricurvus alkylphenolicus TaxID=1306991 RepID=UPI00141DB513|nr:tRNA/rRNA methyltransferase [Pseudomaricurvus alkylphenolicus]NIB42574.1 tRNA/rRNA methyltransferase [Pseudomaricurvus alkylphenolicus]